MDTKASNEEDDDEMFVNEEPEETAAIKQPIIMGGSGGSGGQHGGLVQKIIDSQKQYSATDKQASFCVPYLWKGKCWCNYYDY